MEFSLFKNAVAKQFERMSKHQLFRVNVDKDVLWATYLASFPEGTNPIFKERTEHDCTCCKQFIRAVGDAVAIIDGKVESIWDGKIGEANYQVVSDALSALVKSKPISDTFLHYEPTAGTAKNFMNTVNGVHTWEHFFVNIPAQFVVKNVDIATKLSIVRSTHDVFLRALETLTVDSIETVQELIAQNSLYRGAEQKFAVDAFAKAKQKFDKVKAADRDLFVWSSLKDTVGSVTGIRNSAIGTLLVDLSEGKELEVAVAAFENKMSGTNYKRPTALVTASMVKAAQKKIEDLGFVTALERRYATIDDITINNVLFANRAAKKVIDNVFDELVVTASKKPKSLDKVEEVTIEKFIADILPKAESIELMLENSHTANLVSLIAPVDPTSKNMFKWDNKFSWSYTGEVADSIKERVKAAGGNVSGDLCCRLAWFNHDDLDFHMTEPDGTHISFRDKRPNGNQGGQLDVDMQAGGGTTRTPVENIFYGDRRTMQEGVYRLEVNQWSSRESRDTGFEVEIDFMGTVYRFAYDKKMSSGSTVLVAKFKYSHKDGIVFMSGLPSSTSKVSKLVWGVPTNTFHKVSVMMLSPNYWDDMKVGNKHYFFMLENCLNDGKARGFFNEFLSAEMDTHRKVLEVVGAKMSAVESDKQLSGVGFSSTQPNSILVKVTGSFSRIVKVVF